MVHTHIFLIRFSIVEPNLVQPICIEVSVHELCISIYVRKVNDKKAAAAVATAWQAATNCR